MKVQLGVAACRGGKGVKSVVQGVVFFFTCIGGEGQNIRKAMEEVEKIGMR